MNDKFIIPLNGLAAGGNSFSWHAGKEFFEAFENTEVLDADLNVRVCAEKSGRYLGVDCDVDGYLTVECDRCLEDLEMDVETEIRLSVKYGDEASSEEHQEGGREIVFVPEGDAELDMSQIIYDYVCLSLPIQRCHEDGDCNPDVLKHLGAREADASEAVGQDNPFAALKDLMKNK